MGSDFSARRPFDLSNSIKSASTKDLVQGSLKTELVMDLVGAFEGFWMYIIMGDQGSWLLSVETDFADGTESDLDLLRPQPQNLVMEILTAQNPSDV